MRWPGGIRRRMARPPVAAKGHERSQVRDPNRFRSLYGAGEAAAQPGNRDKARYYCAKLFDLAASGEPRPELEKARRYLAAN